MTDVIQNPFEDFPEAKTVTIFKRGEWEDEFHYLEDDVNTWRSKHEAEINNNTMIVRKLKNHKQWLIDEINRNEYGVVYHEKLSADLRMVKILLGE